MRRKLFFGGLGLLAILPRGAVAGETPITIEQSRAELLPHEQVRMYGDPADWPAAVRDPMVAAQTRGLLLARRHTYGALAADRFAEAVGEHLLPSLPVGSGASVVELRGDDATVHLLQEGPTGVVSVGRVDFDASHASGVFRAATDVVLDPTSGLARSYRAIRLAAADPRYVLKWPTYDADVVPWSDTPADGWAVYLVPSTTDVAHVPLGGGYRVHVSADGATVEAFDALSKTVLEVSVGAMQDGKGMFTSSVLTPVPDATYVAFSKFWRVTMFVVTEDSAWGMSGDALYWLALPL